MNARSDPTLRLSVNFADPLASLRAPVEAIAELAFGSLTANSDLIGNGHLAILPTDVLELDLSDPVQCRFGDYELRELIGKGGMGVVYRAYQHSLDREVAVKLLAAGPWASRDFIERFQHEAQNAARMQHPNIVAIYEVGAAEEMHFFSMRMVHGGSLAAEIKVEGRMPPRRAAQLLRTIAEAVDYAHRLGVLHLDLKPANVLLDENGVPHVADFGLAKRLDKDSSTFSNEVSGTPSYMAPEQATAGTQRITPATDIWGLGAILYELLTGKPPFLGDSPQDTLKLVIKGSLPSPRSIAPELPRDLDAIVCKCMAPRVARRYASARALADDLGRYLDNRPVLARPLNLAQRMGRAAQRQPYIAALASLFVISLIVGIIGVSVQWRRANANAVHAASETVLAEKNAAVSSQRLWNGRRDAALRQMRDGDGFEALTPLLANIEEKQSAGKVADTHVERREIGLIEHQGVSLIDRLIIPEANPMATALSPDGSLLAVTLNDLSVRWYDTATMTERGRVDLLNTLDPNQVPILPRFIDDHHLLVFGEWFEFLPSPSTSGGVLIDLDRKQVVTPPQFADLADISWAADGKHALLHDTHSHLQLWQVEPWRPLSTLAAERKMASSLWVLDPQLRFAVQFGGNMSELRLFDPHHLDAPRPIPLPPHESFSAWAASRDGATLALGTNNGQILLLDLRSLVARQLPGPQGSRVSWLNFSADDAWLAAARSDGAAFAYDVASGALLHAGQMQADFDATRVDIDHRSRLLVVSGQIAGGAGDAQIWHLPQDSPLLGAATHLIASPPHGMHAGPYWLSSNARTGLLASASMDGEVRLWRLPKSAMLGAYPAPVMSGNLYTDGDHVVDTDYDRLRVVWVARGKATPWLTLPSPIVFADMTDQGKTLVAVARTDLHVLDAATLRPRIPVIALRDTPQHFAVSADGKLAALGFNHNTAMGFRQRIALYDLTDGRRLDTGGISVKGPLRQFTLSPDASRLLTTGPADGSTEVFDTRTLKSLGAYPNDPAQPVIWAAFTADSQHLWLVTRNIDETRASDAGLLLWDLRSGKIVERRQVPGVYPVGIATVGEKPLLAGRDALVLDAGAADARTVSNMGNGEATTTFALSHDSRLLAHAVGGYVQLYQAKTLIPIGPPLAIEGSQMNTAAALAFSNDNRHLLAFVDPSVSSPWRLWNVATSQRALTALRSEAAALTPHDDGPRVLRMADARERARLRARDPGPPAVAEIRPTPATARWIGANPIPARNPTATPLQLDLGAVYNRAPQSEANVMNSVMPALSDIPFGLIRIDGVDYDWRGALEMRQDGEGGGTQSGLAPLGIVRGLRVASLPIAALHMLLFAPESVGESRERVYANVRLHYRDGSQAVLHIRTQRDVKGWTEHDQPTPIGWVESTPMVQIGLSGLLQFNNPRLPNPHPGKIIQSLDLETAPNAWSTPVFFAITAEPVIVGAKSVTEKGTLETGTDAGAKDGTLAPSPNGEKP